MESMDAERWIRTLGLVPLALEGGYYRETYRSDESIAASSLPDRYLGRGGRAFGTAIYYLLTAETVSAMHRLRSDEVYHFLAGDPVRMLQLREEGPRSARVVRMANSGEEGTQPQVVVPRGTWQGSRLEPGGRYALMGVTVAPGFEYDDFELGESESLARLFPEHAGEIRRLRRPAAPNRGGGRRDAGPQS